MDTDCEHPRRRMLAVFLGEDAKPFGARQGTDGFPTPFQFSTSRGDGQAGNLRFHAFFLDKSETGVTLVGKCDDEDEVRVPGYSVERVAGWCEANGIGFRNTLLSSVPNPCGASCTAVDDDGAARDSAGI
jgi:hypothetical protein